MDFKGQVGQGFSSFFAKPSLKSHFLAHSGYYPIRHYTVDATSIHIVEPEFKDYVQKSHSARTNS